MEGFDATTCSRGAHTEKYSPRWRGERVNIDARFIIYFFSAVFFSAGVTHAADRVRWGICDAIRVSLVYIV